MDEAGGPARSAGRPDGRPRSRWPAGLNARNVLLVTGVLAIQLAFVASHLVAFHNPKPHRVPIAFAMALQSWTGVIGVGLTVVVLAVLGNPSAASPSMTR